MNQNPFARSLIVCESAVVEESTRKLTLVNCFTIRSYPTFPTPPTNLAFAAFLTDGIGVLNMLLKLTILDTGGVLLERRFRVHFQSPLRPMTFLYRIEHTTFPRAGQYEASLFCEAELLALTRFTFDRKGARA